MSLDDFKFGKNLTTFEGLGPGKSVLRAMGMEAGGMGTIRRVERTDPDGTVHVLNTRNGFPEVVTTKPKKTIFSRFHGLCRKLAVYVGLTEAIAFQPANYLAPTAGHTRYFKAPGTAAVPDRLATPSDYSKTIGDYAILVNGLAYMPTDDSVLLTGMQWLFQGEGNTVRVLGLVLKDYDAMFHSFYVKDYGPFRKATLANPFVALTTLGTITITSTEPYIATLPSVRPSGWFTRTGSTDSQVQHYVGATGTYDPLDTETPTGFEASPDHVRTSGEFQVQASPNGRQIAVMRGFVGLIDDYSRWHSDKYAQVIALSTILTVVTVDISSAMTVGPAVEVFQWEYHFPDDFTASATVRVDPSPYYASLGTWWIKYSLGGIASAGTPYTLKECMGFCYKADGTLKVDYIEQDWGAVQDQNFSLSGPVQWAFFDSGVPATSSAPTTHLVAGEVITRTSYVLNGGFGWGNLGYRSTLRDAPTDRTDLVSCSYTRLTNNVIMLNSFADGPNFYVDYTTFNEVFTPSGRVTFASLFPTTTVNSHFTSYNPATGVLAASNDGTGPICWV